MQKGIDGTVGLGPPNNGPSIVEALYDQETIKTPIVSFQLNEAGNQSYAFFGGLSSLSYTGFLSYQKPITRFGADQWWTLQLTNAFFGEASIHTSSA